MVASSHGKGGQEPTSCSQPGYRRESIDVVVHEEKQRQQPDPVADRSDHHPFVTVTRAFFERAAVDGEDEDECRDGHVPHDVELLITRTLADDLGDRPEVGNQEGKQPQPHAGPFKQTKALDALVKRQLLF